jgi:hypothetical protein
MARALRRPEAVFGTILRLHYRERRGAIAEAARSRAAAAQSRGDEAMAEVRVFVIARRHTRARLGV